VTIESNFPWIPDFALMGGEMPSVSSQSGKPLKNRPKKLFQS
jgi:hypothetical protein